MCVRVCVNVGSEGGGGAVLFKGQLFDAEGFIWE